MTGRGNPATRVSVGKDDVISLTRAGLRKRLRVVVNQADERTLRLLLELAEVCNQVRQGSRPKT